jgi:hypothetical protein
MPNNENPESVTSPPEGVGQTAGERRELPTTPLVGSDMPPVGRQIFRSLSRELNDTDLANPGVQKMLLSELERVDGECGTLRGYSERFHEADKQVGILREKLRTVTSIEVIFGVGMAIGGAVLTLAFSFPEAMKSYKEVFLIVGGVIILGVIGARLIKR